MTYLLLYFMEIPDGPDAFIDDMKMLLAQQENN